MDDSSKKWCVSILHVGQGKTARERICIYLEGKGHYGWFGTLAQAQGEADKRNSALSNLCERQTSDEEGVA